ncbi:Maf-like protein [Rhodovulum sp. 12E13]|uniref:Maf family protein n=1 Tax=Rhodovulum sp. 12E13 TaxID=2203891 RepID=UPI000E167AA9|nr:Maf family protein [Rhodovulum sp. 12E13]RDC73787.1 Maf-like protein [Rhodovulum sp. 12E13]
MPATLTLASTSETRARLLRAAGVEIEPVAPRVDEEVLQDALSAEGLRPRDMADALAEAKAAKIAGRFPDRLVLGADQTAELDGALLTKPGTPDDARAQVAALAGQRHRLHAAAVLYDEGRPVWRHVETVTMHMRPLSASYIDAYIARNWPEIAGSVGAYRLEEEGARFFTRVEGCHFAVQGLPLLPLLSYLATRGLIET